MRLSDKILLLVLILYLLGQNSFSQRTFSQRKHGAQSKTSGGPLIFEQSVFDVKSYDITAQIDPQTKSISGETIIEARIIHPANLFVIDLDTPFKISNISLLNDINTKNLKFERREEKIWIQLPLTKQPGEFVSVKISYSGKPRIAPNPPWVGGFMWEKTADGSDWITVACQGEGGDLWYPVKDHPSDEPDNVSLHITVPENLYVASVGKLRNVKQNPDGTKTYYWFMSNPINNYNVVLNIAPYKIIEQNYKSIAGETFPIKFYALPESAEKAKDIVNQTVKFLRFYEKYLGPYPYRKEKLGIAETPHLGMEHSTIIAYGNKFKKDERGFDWLMLHELGHEWWGNMVTVSDWKDMWIHEGFQAFMDSLYIEETKGREAYLKSMSNYKRRLQNKLPVAPRQSLFSHQIYFLPPNYTTSNWDIYGKGALILHSLRYLIGDKAFFRGLRRMAYPERKIESITDGDQNRFVTTDDVKQIFEEESKTKLDWFFEVYLHQPKLPELISETIGNKLRIRWKTPGQMLFPMPVDVEMNGVSKRIAMKEGKRELDWNGKGSIKIDKKGWVLKK